MVSFLYAPGFLGIAWIWLHEKQTVSKYYHPGDLRPALRLLLPAEGLVTSLKNFHICSKEYKKHDFVFWLGSFCNVRFWWAKYLSDAATQSFQRAKRQQQSCIHCWYHKHHSLSLIILHERGQHWLRGGSGIWASLIWAHNSCHLSRPL